MPHLAYVAFDVVPAPKGAAIHIQAFVQGLAQTFGHVTLMTVAPKPPKPAVAVPWPGVTAVALPARGATLIHRVMDFRQQLYTQLAAQPRFDLIHIRSIYEGLPIAREKTRWCDRLVFEVNGLPSIELKYRYPDVEDDDELLKKLIAQERICCAAADRIITPSPVTRDYLMQRGVAPEKITVIPNGVDLATFTYQPPRPFQPEQDDAFDVLYFGTLSSWQGVNLLVRAIAMVQPQLPARLTLIGPASKGQRDALAKLAKKLGVGDRVYLCDPTTQADLVAHLHRSHCTVAPLTPCDRNLVQGCCPLKVLEGMAAGTPVIASDLPVVHAIATPDHHYLPVKPGAVSAIAEALIALSQAPTEARHRATKARHHIEQHFTWAQANTALIGAYRALGL